MSALENAQLHFTVADELGRPLEAAPQLLLSENVERLGRQYRVAGKPGLGELGGSFPAGLYTAQLFAKGHEVVRETIRLEAGQALRRLVRLCRRAYAKPGTEQRLAVYGLAEPGGLKSLTVRSGERVVLDQSSPHCRVLRPDSAWQLKSWIGAPDAASAGKAPRFGQPPSGLDAAMREFLYGNARAVGDFQTAIEARFAAEPVEVPIFLFDAVTIEDCAVLEIGAGASIFFCTSLTMHPQGVVRAAGDVRADIGLCVQL
jgi:hypothetical protein